jgi:hypothetical protein
MGAAGKKKLERKFMNKGKKKMEAQCEKTEYR